MAWVNAESKEVPAPAVRSRATLAKKLVQSKSENVALSVVCTKFGPLGEPVLVDVEWAGLTEENVTSGDADVKLVEYSATPTIRAADATPPLKLACFPGETGRGS